MVSGFQEVQTKRTCSKNLWQVLTAAVVTFVPGPTEISGYRFGLEESNALLMEQIPEYTTVCQNLPGLREEELWVGP